MKEENVLHNQLKAIRTRLGLSQQELATSAGIARQTIGGIEAELYAPSAMIALRLAKALGCRVEEIFWLDGESAQVSAIPVMGLPPDTPLRVTLAQVGGKWVAHPLRGESAFRSEMIPADGIGQWHSGEETFTVNLLDDPEVLARTVVIAGCTPVLSLWAKSAERWFPGLRVHWRHANSREALYSLARGEVHLAGVHLCDAVTGEYTAPFVREVLPDRATVLINLGVGREGFVVAAGNPKGLESVEDLQKTGVRLINRESGAGSRSLLDSLLETEGIAGGSILGYEEMVRGHQEVAFAVSTGRADVGVSTEAIAETYGLDFVFLRQVRYDLVLLEETLLQEPVRQLLSTLQHRRIRSQLSLLGGYDTSLTGERADGLK